jgi:hypothetical protein
MKIIVTVAQASRRRGSAWRIADDEYGTGFMRLCADFASQNFEYVEYSCENWKIMILQRSWRVNDRHCKTQGCTVLYCTVDAEAALVMVRSQ